MVTECAADGDGVRAEAVTLARLPSPPPGRSGWPWTEAPAPLPPRRADGSPWPRISIVTGSHNQRDYLEETLRSVLLQGYPDLEYIVVDGGSADGSPQIIERYAPFLTHWEAQPDRGQAAALNSGFRHATGDILAYLNSDDTYLPGALERIALAIDERHHHLVTGRCLFVDSTGRSIGSEHASRAVSHRRLLAVWKGHAVPQPATFWSRAAWREGGPLTEDAGVRWIDYDLLCRMTRRYRLHAVDQILATYRLHPTSITTTTGAAAAYQEILCISRRYWGPLWSPRHLLLSASLALHRLDRLGRGRTVIRRARERRAAGRRLDAFALTGLAALLAPDLLLRLALERRPPAARPCRHQDSCGRPAGPGEPFRDRTQPWLDRWVGPRLHLDLAAAGGESRLRVEGTAAPAYLGAPLGLVIRIDGRHAGGATIEGDGPFAVEVPLAATAVAGSCRVEIEASPCFVPDTLLGNGDQRRLCWLLHEVGLRP